MELRRQLPGLFAIRFPFPSSEFRKLLIGMLGTNFTGLHRRMSRCDVLLPRLQANVGNRLPGLQSRSSSGMFGCLYFTRNVDCNLKDKKEQNKWRHCKILNYSGSLFFCVRISFFPLGRSTRRNSSNASLSQVVAFARTILTRGRVNGAGLVNWC